MAFLCMHVFALGTLGLRLFNGVQLEVQLASEMLLSNRLTEKSNTLNIDLGT